MTPTHDPAKAFPRATSLRLWIPLSVALFVLLGSLSLWIVFEKHRKAEEQSAFENMARVNAGFIERTRLAQSEMMAERLSEITGLQVFFWHSKVERLIGPPGIRLDQALLKNETWNGKARRFPDGRMVVGIQGERGMHILFVRDGLKGSGSLMSSDAWLALAIFWMLSLVLGFGLSRWVTQPLQGLVKLLPLVGTQDELIGLPLGRKDEIGSLAQALNETHQSLKQERELRRRAERHAILGRMAASMAHEIRNPVSAIRLHAELMDVDSPADFADSRRLVLSEAERLESLVRQWMNYAKPEPPHLVEMDLVEAIRHARDLMLPQAKHAGVVFEWTDGPDRPLMILADRQRIQQVLGNVLINAVQAMPTGGRVTIGVGDEGDKVRVSIADEGVGFSEMALKHLGDAFFSEKEGGMGLGLAVAKGICEAHGGALSAQTNSGRGACVLIELPKSPKDTRDS